MATTVQEIVTPPRRWIAVIHGVTHVTGDAGEIVIDLGDGPVRVAVTKFALHGSWTKSAGIWSDLVAASGGRLATLDAPAYARATLSVCELAVGQPIEIYGEVEGHRFMDDGGLRDAPSTRIGAIRARIVCTGTERATRMTELIASL